MTKEKKRTPCSVETMIMIKCDKLRMDLVKVSGSQETMNRSEGSNLMMIRKHLKQ